MKEKRKKHWIGIESQNFFEFLQIIDEHVKQHDDVKVDYWSKEPPFRAVLEWTEVDMVPETIRDEFELAGEIYHCIDCPHLDMTNYWKSKKKYPCKYSTYGMTFTTSCACEVFYKGLMRGEIKPREEQRDE